MRYLWVVEILIDGRWQSTVGVKLNRKAGRKELKQWQKDNPRCKFQLVKYEVTE
jgi:hypothetical protein